MYIIEKEVLFCQSLIIKMIQIKRTMSTYKLLIFVIIIVILIVIHKDVVVTEDRQVRQVLKVQPVRRAQLAQEVRLALLE